MEIANAKAGQMYKQNLEHLNNIDHLDAETQEMVKNARDFQGNSNNVYLASYWLNKKYALLIFGSLTVLILFIVLFVYRLFIK